MRHAIPQEAEGFLSILTATLCVALILALPGCASVPAAGVKHAIEDRLKTQEAPQAACPNPVNITIISNGVPHE